MRKIKKIIHIVGSLELGGLETVAVNYGKYFNDPNFEFTYLVYGDKKGELEQEVIECGFEIIRIPEPKKNYLQFYRNVVRVLKNNGPFDICHSHPLFNSGIISRAAYAAGIPKRIVQAHSSQKNISRSTIKIFYQNLMRYLMKKFATDYLAVSSQAGQFLFGNDFSNKNTVIMKNAIDVNKYRLKNLDQNKCKKYLELEGKIVLGHVGNLKKVKNQEFLIKLMPKLIEIESDFVLILIGDGPERERLLKLIEDLNLKNNIFLFGQTREIDDLLQVIDIFLFPSLYEGFGLALLEAQAASLPCVISANIPSEVVVNESVYRISLNNTGEWIERILSLRNFNKKNEIVKVKNSGYDIEYMIKELKKVYFD